MTIESVSPSAIQGLLAYRRTPIEKESPEEYGYDRIKYNLAESSVPDMILGILDLDLSKLALSYGDHLGNPRLREAIAGEEETFTPEQILITTGAAGALFIIATSLLTPNDHVVVLHPNYVANLEAPRAIGCQIDYLRLRMEDQFQLDVSQLEQLITPSTRLVSLTYPQNPTGMMLTESALNEIVSLVEAKGCYLLLDETYRDMTFNQPPLPIAASLSSQVISVSSFSKAYGLPGIRLGWLATQNARLMETFLAAKELIFICNSLVDEEIGTHFFISKKQQFLAEIQGHVFANFEVMQEWMKKNDYLEWIKPQGGCVCFPRIKTDINIDINAFYELLKEQYRTFVAPGRWFEVDRRFMRIGYGYPSQQELVGGLECINQAISDTAK
ncbi:MAG: aminotransferase class I/II-fold pyridoxal phosphate-dependent enzyme [Candidatus Hodarchaeales archaeon]|jgi:aspartate/methionine/tyrosine aminotransferase